ncbi:unnamed protein product [Trifolium pratense]|uniref:Uncharacterized protein n=1 Tax=Trifolium pratense TaxID=57577 RepID=A0ACB0KXG2_TRIPR|nr:unnamed protein product [Trifolium pratense]
MGTESEQNWHHVSGRHQSRKDKSHNRIDIATIRRQQEEFDGPQVTYFFTDFPESFGAKAMSNVFQNYGDIVEVVIPARRDRRGERFGFARFEKVTDIRRFEYELDGIIIGRDKISVNISRFQRPERQHDQSKGDGENKATRTTKKDHNRGSKTDNNLAVQRGGSNSYANAVKKVKNGASSDGFSSISPTSINRLCHNGERGAISDSEVVKRAGCEKHALCPKKATSQRGQKGDDFSSSLGAFNLGVKPSSQRQNRSTLNGKEGISRASTNTKPASINSSYKGTVTILMICSCPNTLRRDMKFFQDLE